MTCPIHKITLTAVPYVDGNSQSQTEVCLKCEALLTLKPKLAQELGYEPLFDQAYELASRGTIEPSEIKSNLHDILLLTYQAKQLAKTEIIRELEKHTFTKTHIPLTHE